MRKFKLQIVTPMRNFFEEEVESIIVKAFDGDLGIMAKHLEIATVLDVGIIKIKSNNNERRATINGGFLEIDNNIVSIFTDSAEWPEEIDPERALQAKERAEERIKRHDHGVDLERAEYALKRAVNRLNITKR